MNKAYLLLGGNQGDTPAILAMAQQLLNDNLGETLLASPLYKTAAWGKTDQPEFLNQALLISTKHNADNTLGIIQQIESKLGRQRTEHWGQRTLDIDILFFNNELINTPTLTVPHPQLHNRRFALLPLSSIAAELTHPLFNCSVAALLTQCTDHSAVVLYNHNQ